MFQKYVVRFNVAHFASSKGEQILEPVRTND